MKNKFLSKIKQKLIHIKERDADNFVGYYTIPICYEGAPYNLPFIYYTSGQCSYDRIGSCIMCNFGRQEHIDDNTIIKQVKEVIKSFKGFPAIYITPAGSMLDDVEVSSYVRCELFKEIKENGFLAVKTETRPEFVTAQKLHQIREIIGFDVDLEIGLGLESSNEWVLKNCINKMLSLNSITKAIDISHQFQASVYVHILVNPPFLNEKEAIQDAISSAQWAFDQGADLIGLALTNIKPDTVTLKLMDLGLYKPPSYWTLIKILMELPDAIRSRVGLFGADSSVPILHPMSSCPACCHRLRSMLDAWCYTGDFLFIYEADRYPCLCKKKWDDDLNNHTIPLKERIAYCYEILAKNIYSEDWWNNNNEWILKELNEPSEINLI